MKSLREYLRAYYKMQENILLVYRPTLTSSWADRCFYLEEGYDQYKDYNHRLILTKEVVIEFDDDDPRVNEEQAQVVCKRLRADGITYSLWDSGNKSLHIHFFVNPKNAGNIRLLKKVVMRYYTEGLPLKPDMRLAADSHLIRAEYGLHEKSGRRKRPIFKGRNYLQPNILKDAIWQRYADGRTTTIRRQTSKDLGEACNCVKYIGSAESFRENQDGCERALFILLHSGLKSKYSEPDLEDYLWEWYKYAGGYKLKEQQVRSKVRYHYNRNYGTFTMIKELLEDLGKEEVLAKCELHGSNKNKEA